MTKWNDNFTTSCDLLTSFKTILMIVIEKCLIIRTFSIGEITNNTEFLYKANANLFNFIGTFNGLTNRAFSQ